jgi:hypothetical protein
MRMSGELDEIASLIAEIEAASHVGRRNRLMTRQGHVFDAIDADPDRIALLRALLAHPEPAVRMAAAWRCGWRHALPEEAERAVTELAERPGAIGQRARQWLGSRARMATYQWAPPPTKTLSYDPMPAGCSPEAAAELIARAFAKKRARTLQSLLLRVIRLWPRARADDPRASCFGGLPALPQGYVWPTFEGEPLLFLGQINCAEVRAAIGPNPLPERGLLEFYGDHDEVTGCGPSGSGVAFYFRDPDALEPVPAPVPGFLELPRCGLDFYETVELPDPLSDVVAGLRLSPAETESYRKLKGELAALTGPRLWPDRPSKLLGWPDLIQRDLGEDCGEPDAGVSLLLQIGWWHDGARSQAWGPGGLVYFILGRRAIEDARFDRAAMEMQCS